tara:strand:- start:68 stop:1135 length:1068 start_codon:yes stop_codon:yes gene_type:complete
MIKLKPFLVAILFSISSLYGDVAEIRNQLQLLSTEPSENKREMSIRVGKVLKEVQIYIRAADSQPFAKPSKERLRRINEVQNTIDPHKSWLIDLGKPTSQGQGIYAAFSLLYYSKPSSELKQQLVEVTKIKNSLGASAKAYDLIFDLGLDDENIRNEVADRILDQNPKNSLKKEEAEILYQSETWKIKELVPSYIKLLEREDLKESNKPYSRLLLRIIRKVKGMGHDALEIIPVLEKQLELYINSESANAENDPWINRNIKNIRKIIQDIKNDKKVPTLTMSGVGLQNEIAEEPIEIAQAPEPVQQAAKGEAVSIEKVEEPELPKEEEKKSPLILYLIGIAVLVGIYLVTRKKKS